MTLLTSCVANDPGYSENPTSLFDPTGCLQIVLEISIEDRRSDEVEAERRLQRSIASRISSHRAETPSELPGFGELIRAESLKQVPSWRERIAVVNAVFPEVPYCLDLIGAARIETDTILVKAFRPKS